LLVTDIINITLSISLFLIYVTRTYHMCKFDKNPIWQMPITSAGPKIIDNVYAKDLWLWDNSTETARAYLPVDKLSEHFFPSNECTGEFYSYYYLLLFISHGYFLIEFSLRALTSKEMTNFLNESDSIIEIFTTVPFFVLWFIFGIHDYYFQLFLAFDCMRLFLYDRYFKYIKTELT
jgi:hypothetical protein